MEQLENNLYKSDAITVPKITVGIVSDIISSNYGFKPINEGIATAVPLEKILLLACIKLLRTQKKPTVHMVMIECS